MQNYRSLPFAVYDLAFYLPGGALLLMLGQYTLASSFSFSAIPDLEFLKIEGFDTLNSFVVGVLLLSASYLAGHLGAFFSTYVIERFVHNALGFPSEIWWEADQIDVRGRARSDKIRRIFSDKIADYNWCFPSVMVGLAQLPLTFHFVIFRLFLPVGFYMPALPVGLLTDVRLAFEKVGSSIEVGRDTRWEKVVEHYVANNCPTAYVRMYNYLVIYGALRLLAFILLGCCWVILFKSIYSYLYFPFVWEWSPRRIFLLGVLSTSAFFAMMAFAKFNRRYFEEALLALLYAPPLESKPTTTPATT
ncbi:MAG: hypothetical protein AAFQ27_11900 [Pseudomonadota bacterium]